MRPRRAKALMFMGTGSDVGKSLLVAGLCRHFSNQGLTVRPFKPQNMSNNAAVTAEGGEIGRAQALQARACRAAPSVHMNPILLKPQSEVGAQVVVQGRMHGNAKAADYQALKGQLLPAVLDSFAQLTDTADLVLVEGAGSAAEVNLRAGDIANWGFACAAQTPVVLIGDIDRGGVIAALVGTHQLISDQERTLLAGYAINKFRGDPSLFDGGLRAIQEHTRLRSFGIVPYFFDAARLPAEDALALDHTASETGDTKVVVLRTPRIANFDDLDPLRQEPGVRVDFLTPGKALPGDTDLVILAGSKATIADLAFLKQQGWDGDVAAHVRRGGRVLGLCGGYQMLGTQIHDPTGIEGPAGSVPGLGLLQVETRLTARKTLSAVTGVHLATGQTVQGYEMHIGQTQGPDTARPVLDLAGRAEGAQDASGRVVGTYVHGLFAADAFRQAWLTSLQAATSDLAYEAQIDRILDDLAAHLATHLDTGALLATAR